MEQRRLRLGDIVDDYCPRERRVTNHAIVAMIEDDIKQTRCTTCDAEHAYKGAKVPRRRRKEAPAHLAAPAVSTAGAEDETTETRAVDDGAAPFAEQSEAFAAQPVAAAAGEAPSVENADESATAEPAALEDGPVHRPLIRATLPRPEGQKAERPLPDFTIRHAPGRGGSTAFRGNGRPKVRPHGGANGGRPHGRFAGARPGPGRGGPHAGFRTGQPRHGGKKRSR